MGCDADTTVILEDGRCAKSLGIVNYRRERTAAQPQCVSDRAEKHDNVVADELFADSGRKTHAVINARFNGLFSRPFVRTLIKNFE